MTDATHQPLYNDKEILFLNLKNFIWPIKTFYDAISIIPNSNRFIVRVLLTPNKDLIKHYLKLIFYKTEHISILGWKFAQNTIITGMTTSWMIQENKKINTKIKNQSAKPHKNHQKEMLSLSICDSFM